MVARFFEAVGVEDLHLKAGIHGLLHITHAHEHAAVTLGVDLEFEIEHEVTVQFLCGDVGVIPLPAFLALTRVQGDAAILLDDPVARRFPASEVLAIKERDETSRVSRRVKVFGMQG